MFSSLGLFKQTLCPVVDECQGTHCPFSHDKHSSKLEADTLVFPVSLMSASAGPSTPSKTIPIKRPAADPVESSSQMNKKRSASSPMLEPPKKLQRTLAGVKTRGNEKGNEASSTSTGPPILRIIAACPVPVRQTMLQTIYSHFQVLYHNILDLDPTLASDHALRQEAEVYETSTKASYRNAVIQSVGAIKRRPIPDKIFHSSVGTEGDIVARKASEKALKNLFLTKAHLEPFVHSVEELEKWGFLLQVPDGPGGERPFHEGMITCDRCKVQFLVQKDVDDPMECKFHWGRIQTRNVGGERTRVYDCCSQPTSEAGGCTSGRHVFYEKEPEELHARHAFSELLPVKPEGNPTQLDVIALDCEMCYTTGGMRVARVSCVDGNATTVFDEFVKMDEGVEIIDFNTRFSGITQELYDSAVLQLFDIRKALDGLMNQNTILVGHALNNDLNTLRIVHRRCVDTSIIFQRNGYRRSLRDLVRQHLGIAIQAGGGTKGHSSVEDSIATLDLLRWHILEKQKTITST
ncbi:ribonuclease H-like protein [Flagelloscypha sp. PMI_526]|nr:ribonuclease H-like protein [Flagelloscypha sp. PMI_526]